MLDAHTHIITLLLTRVGKKIHLEVREQGVCPYAAVYADML